MKEVNDKNFDSEIQLMKIIVVDFAAEWCVPCKVVGPILEDLEKDFKDTVNFLTCDVDSNPKSSIKYSIRNIPAVLFFKNGIIVDKQIGVVAKSVYTKKLEQLLK